MKRIMECVPNFSEGRDRHIIAAIVSAILHEEGHGARPGSEGGVKVLHTDSGEAAGRTVITFAGEPEAVVEAAFRGVECASRLIDMRKHSGVHPRLGSTDVLPLVPVSGISLEECAAAARSLAGRIYGELGIPCYCYEAAAFSPERKNLAWCRAGEYESLPQKIADPARRPDFSPESYNSVVAKCGATNVGARDFLIAVNFNLDTASVEIAKDIACEVREKGRKNVPGLLKGCKAIGWYIEEYGVAQVSMNITDINATPLHIAYEQVCRSAARRGVRVTGTEIIGLVPERVLLEAGLHFLGASSLSGEEGSKEEAVSAAVEYMGLDDLRPFNAREKVIEYLLDI